MADASNPLDQFDALAASSEAKRRGLGPIAEREFMMGAASAIGAYVPAPALKFVNRRAEGFEWAKRTSTAA